MTGSEIKSMAESIVDDSINEDLFYTLLNAEKDIVEGNRLWQFLKKLDSSKTASTGNNYNTGISLPSDWRSTYKLYVGEDLEYVPVAFEKLHLYRNLAHYYIVDVAGSNFYLLGNVGQSDTIYHYYIKTTDDIAEGTSPVWPSRYHRILGFRVAARFMAGVDVDDIFAALSQENRVAALELSRAMEVWDSQLKNAENDKRLHYTDGEQPSEDVILGYM